MEVDNPYTLVPCGHSFSFVNTNDLKNCPTCELPITGVVSNSLGKLSAVPTSSVYELFCVDVSTSMWKSDYRGPFSLLLGPSRLQTAKDFIVEMGRIRANDSSQKMGLVTFGTNENLVCQFSSPRDFLKCIGPLQASESRTRLFDAVEFCVAHLNADIFNSSEKRLHILTDGGENFSKNENVKKFEAQISGLNTKIKKFQVVTVVWNVGGESALDQTKSIADNLGAVFKDINKGNCKELAKIFCVQFPNREDKMHALLSTAPIVPNSLPAIKVSIQSTSQPTKLPHSAQAVKL